MAEAFEKNARTVSLLTLVSRITGLARDATLSRVFGAGPLMDAFFFAFLVPNLFRRLFGEGALTAAFLPVYSRLETDHPEAARALASLVVARLALWLGGITLVGEIALFVLSHQAQHSNVALWLMMIMLPYMPLICLVALLGAMLQVHGRFGPTAAAPVILNLAIIGAAIGWLPFAHIGGDTPRVVHIGVIAAAVIVSGCAQLIWSLAALRRRPWWTRDVEPGRRPLREVLGQAGPMILGLGVLQVNTLIDGVIASYPTTVGETIFGVAYPLEAGAMAAISFAQRLYQFPLGVFGIAIATAIFPLLARQANRPDDFKATLRRGLRLTMYIGLPASVGLMLVREPLTAAILQGGDFSPDDTQRVGFVLLGYAPAIWAYSMMHTMTRAFYSRGDAKTPVRVAIAVVALNVVLNCTLIWTPLREAGLAWSTAICATIQAAVLVLLIRRSLPGLISRDVGWSWARTAGISAFMAVAVYLVAGEFAAPAHWSTALWQVAAQVGLGAFIVGLLSIVLRMPELRWATGRTD